MPVTPYHMGPALLLKAGLGRHLSLPAFGLVQVVIDVESAVHLLRHDWPVHRTLHTLPGALAVGLAAIPVARWLALAWNQRLPGWRARSSLPDPAWLLPRVATSWTAMAVGALLGAVTHVLLDATMHDDMVPFAPFWPGNPLLLPWGVVWPHVPCALAGVIGAALWLQTPDAAARRR